MLGINKNTLIIVGASTAVGFLGDLMVYSLSESKGKKFAVHMPKGWNLVNLIALGIATGVVIDFSLKKLEIAMANKQERELAKVVDMEKEKITKGVVAGKIPTGVNWV